MKVTFVLVVVTTVLIIGFGSPFAGQKAAREHYYQSPAPVLPMTFAHMDHVTVNCIDCHHNYVDDTGDGNCMTCHMTDEELWQDLEKQFHTLCRDCHAEREATGEDGGPPRRCISCHMADDLP